MSGDDENPFVRFGLDPSAPLAELTERLRERAEDASDEERVALRAAWDALSRSPARRLQLALEAGPTPTPIATHVEGPIAPPAPWPEPTLGQVLAPQPVLPQLPPETPHEAALRALDLSFLVRSDESAVTGPLGPRSQR